MFLNLMGNVFAFPERRLRNRVFTTVKAEKRLRKHRESQMFPQQLSIPVLL